jgi:hypothetical protein
MESQFHHFFEMFVISFHRLTTLLLSSMSGFLLTVSRIKTSRALANPIVLSNIILFIKLEENRFFIVFYFLVCLLTRRVLHWLISATRSAARCNQWCLLWSALCAISNAQRSTANSTACSAAYSEVHSSQHCELQKLPPWGKGISANFIMHTQGQHHFFLFFRISSFWSVVNCYEDNFRLHHSILDSQW